MKIDDRGWISVKKLRELLIEVPGDYLVTPYKDKLLYISDTHTETGKPRKHVGDVEFMEEKVTYLAEKEAA